MMDGHNAYGILHWVSQKFTDCMVVTITILFWYSAWIFLRCESSIGRNTLAVIQQYLTLMALKTIRYIYQRFVIARLQMLQYVVIWHIYKIPTMQFFAGMSRNTQSKLYMLSLTECVWVVKKCIVGYSLTCPVGEHNSICRVLFYSYQADRVCSGDYYQMCMTEICI